MQLTIELANQGFCARPAREGDFADYLSLKRECFRPYVERFYGRWDEKDQAVRNRGAFEQSLAQTCFLCLMQHGKTVGFMGYDVLPDRIDGLSLQLTQGARGFGLGTWFLQEVIRQSEQLNIPVTLKVFRGNPAKTLYARMGFAVCGETSSHLLMQREPTRAGGSSL